MNKLAPITVFMLICATSIALVILLTLSNKEPSSEGTFNISSHYYYNDMIILNASDTLSEAHIIEAFKISIIERRMWLLYVETGNADTQEKMYSPEDMIQNNQSTNKGNHNDN